METLSNVMTSMNYKKPHLTYTLDQFIQCQSDNTVCYNTLSFIDEYGNIKYNTYNVFSDYLDIIREDYCIKVKLNDEQLAKYKYKPKLLCFDIYSNQELAFIIMIINDMCNVKEFTKSNLLMPTKDNMKNIVKYIYNSNRSDISVYNYKNKSNQQ